MLILVPFVLLQTPDITVVGARSPAQTSADVKASIRATTPIASDDQYARWNTPVCPTVVGVAPDLAARVLATIRQEAAAARIKLRAAPCVPNVTVAFVADASAATLGEWPVSPSALQRASPAERRALLGPERAVRWWYRYETTGSDGRAFTAEPAMFGANASSTDAIPLPRNGRVSSSYSSTLIGTKVRVNLTGATVLVDANRASGATLDAVSALVARVALAPAGLISADPAMPSVLAEPRSPEDRPARLTDYDRAYLWALYRTPPDRPASQQRARMAGLIAQRLGR